MAKARSSGSAVRHGNSRSFYDGQGRYTGSVISTSPRRRASTHHQHLRVPLCSVSTFSPTAPVGKTSEV